MEFTDISIGVIGGSGLDSIDSITVLGTTHPNTPWGYPSSPIKVCQLNTSNIKVAFLPRHGAGHFTNPSQVNYRANIAALKHMGVRVIVAFSAVGSLVEEISPGHLVVPDQLIDVTKGLRPCTFFEDGIVGHVPFAEPFHAPLAGLILEHKGDLAFHSRKTLICMEGPAFSTKAESMFYKSAMNGHIINMSAVPETKLAREAEIAYQMICLVTDYDCWRPSEDSVNVEAVLKTMVTNKHNAIALLERILPDLHVAICSGTYKDSNFFDGVENVSKFAVMTAPSAINPDAAKRLNYILPNYSYTSS